MEELILLTLRLVFAILWSVVEGLFYWPFDFGFEKVTSKCPMWLVLFLYFAGGCALGGVSLLFLPHAWLPEASLRIINLITAPIVGGAVGFFSAKHYYNNVDTVEPREHFWSGFWFALGVAAIRFVYCVR